MCMCLGFCFFCDRYTQTAADWQSCSGSKERSKKCLGEAAGGFWLWWGPQSCEIQPGDPLGVTMWCDAYGLQPHWVQFPSRFPSVWEPSLVPLDVPLQRVAEMGCCLSSQGSGKPHGVVQRLLQVLHSHATSTCIELIFMAVCLSSTWHNLRL